MTNERYWKLADKYERHYETNMDMEVFIDGEDDLICEVVYYCKGILSEAKENLRSYNEALTKKLKSGWDIKAANFCDYYKLVGKETYKKTYKKVFTK